MTTITLAQLEQIIFQNGELFIPDAIENAIISKITQELGSINDAGEELAVAYEPDDNILSAEYDKPEVVDAYSLFYLRRNVLIPRIAMRDILVNQKTRNLPDRMRILDLGCGTGAVTLGFLEMFSHPPLNGIKIEIDAIDISSPSLNRLKQLVDTLNFSGFQINTIQMDLRDISTLEKYLSCNAPYNIVFAANVLNELEHVQSIELIKSISQHLTNMAFIVIASAAKDFIKKKLQQMLITDANNRGLFVYYPCPSYSSSNSSHKCWFWRAHEYKYKTLRKKDGRIIPPGRFQSNLSLLGLFE